MMIVRANGLDFSCLTWGQGPLVLLLHGFPDTPHTWDLLGPGIAAQGFRVVAPFMRGYAPTGMPKADTTSRDLGEDVVALISAVGADKAHLIGHDWGSEAVYAAVGLAPERVLSLTGIGVPHRAALPPAPRFAWALRHFVTLSLPGAEGRFERDDFAELEMLIRRWSPTWKFTAADLAPIKACFRAPGTVHAALGYYRASVIRTPPFMKARIAVPMLYVAGADDPGVRPSDFEATKGHFASRFEVVAVPGGHFCHRESGPALLPHLLRHLQG